MVNINLSEIISVGVGIVGTGVTWYAHNKGWLAKVFPWLKKPLQVVDNAAQTVVTDAEHLFQNGQAQIVIHNLQSALDSLSQSGAQSNILADVQILLTALGKSAATLTPTEIGWMVAYAKQNLPSNLQRYVSTASVMAAIKTAESTVATVAGSKEFESLQSVVKYATEATAPKA